MWKPLGALASKLGEREHGLEVVGAVGTLIYLPLAEGEAGDAMAVLCACLWTVDVVCE